MELKGEKLKAYLGGLSGKALQSQLKGARDSGHNEYAKACEAEAFKRSNKNNPKPAPVPKSEPKKEEDKK